jgi:diacylglycerol kinase (ATP)
MLRIVGPVDATAHSRGNVPDYLQCSVPLLDLPLMERPKLGGWQRLRNSFGASYRGISGAIRDEAAFRQELLVAVPVCIGGALLGRTGVEKALLICPMLLILVVELLNSAIEATVDRIGLEHHELSGLAKDLGSAAVMFSFGLLGLSWLLVLFF